MKQTAIAAGIVLMCIASVAAQTHLEERVRVSWWLVPMFVVDADGAPVQDLEKGEVSVSINGKELAEFTLYRREFGLEQTVKRPDVKRPSIEKRKIIFFVFDTAFGSKKTFELSKKIAEDVVASAEPSTLFVVMAINPYDGLVYKAGPLTLKSRIIKSIDSDIKWHSEAKNIATVLKMAYSAQIAGQTKGKAAGSVAKYDARGMAFLLEEVSHSLRNTNQRYLDSFETLYHALNTIKEHKMVYLFTEGISVFARRSIRYVDGEYRYFIKKAAGHLSRSGAVLFIVNPAGATESYLSMGSGEDSLRYFALESGGAYLEGEREAIGTKLHRMQRAFYEIGFADRGDLREPLRVEINCNREGVKIHTLNQLQREKPFASLQSMEKEIVVVNLMTANPLFKSQLRIQSAPVDKTTTRGDSVIYKVSLPKNWRGREIELFQGSLREKDQDIVIQSRSLITAAKSLKIRFENKPGHINAFLIVNANAKQALMKGFFETEAWRAAVPLQAEIKPLSKEYTYNENLPAILAGAARYCRNLSEAAFRFVCLEKVVERRDALKANMVTDISEYDARATSVWDTLNRINRIPGNEASWVKKYTYDYQIIRDGKTTRERRIPLSQPKKDESRGRPHAHLQSFMSSRVVFAPLTLLGESRQQRYDFKFVKYNNFKGRRCAVIEAMPMAQTDSQFVFGQVWLDDEDHSVRKIVVNPRSIGRYEQLHQLAGYLGAKLFLIMEIEFDRVHRGLYFPTRIVLSELYKGGPLISRMRGGRGWERNRTIFTYSKYRFFEVSSEVID